jgi:hypothetical protein
MTASGRIVAMVAGAVLALGGLGAGAAGGLLLGVFGSDGEAASGWHRVSTPRTALVTGVSDIEDVSGVSTVVGDPSLRLAVRGPEPFVGIGPAARVERYLASAPIDEITDFELDPFELKRKPRAGSGRPAAPADQGFWVAQGTGRAQASLSWKVRDGEYRLVVMNADANRGVDVRMSAALELPHVAGIAWALIAAGALLLIGAVALLLKTAATPARGAPT